MIYGIFVLDMILRQKNAYNIKKPLDKTYHKYNIADYVNIFSYITVNQHRIA